MTIQGAAAATTTTRAATIARARSNRDAQFATSAHRPGGSSGASWKTTVLRHLGTRRFEARWIRRGAMDLSAGGVPPGATALHALAAANPAYPNLAAMDLAEESSPALRVLFAAGGTGGHVFPAIAIADALRRMSDEGSLPAAATARIDFAGTDHHQEATHVPAAGYALHRVPAIALARPLLSWRNVLVPFKLAYAVARSIVLITELAPDVVVGTGGYVSLPTCLAAKLCGVPLVIQEQNAYPGVANRILAKAASLVCVAFAKAAEAFRMEPLGTHDGTLGTLSTPARGGACVVRGNPIRAPLRWTKRTDARRTLSWMFYRKGCAETPSIRDTDRVLVVFGGSMGCETLNDAMSDAVGGMLERDPRLWVVWQTGRGGYERVRSKTPSHPRLAVRSFINDVENCYAAADLCVARAGAVTCSELLASGLPSVLIPSPVVTEDHQSFNAKEMADLGAAVEIRDCDLAPKDPKKSIKPGEPAPRRTVRLDYVIGELLYDPEVLAGMREACLEAAAPEAAEAIANDVVSVALAARRRRAGGRVASLGR